MITDLNIYNFKAFQQTGTIKLGALTLLTGINGRGKSSFLQSILLVSQSIINSATHTPVNLITNGIWLNLGTFNELTNIDSLDNNIRFQFHTDAKIDNHFELSYSASQSHSGGELYSMKVNDMETFIELGSYGENINPNNKERIPPTFSGYTSLINLQNLYYIAAERNSAQNEEALSTNVKIHMDARGRNILNIIFQQGDDFQHEIEKYLNQIFEGATFKIKSDEKTLHLYMDATNNGKHFKPVNVGYGYSYVLTLLTAGLLAKKGEIIIIENPEAHLHPSAQASIMHFFINDVLNKGVQIFMETHSDHIVNASLIAVRKADVTLTNEQLEILFFNRYNTVNNDISIQNLEITSKGRVKNPPKKFCDQYAMDLKTLMGFD